MAHSNGFGYAWFTSFVLKSKTVGNSKGKEWKGWQNENKAINRE